MERLMILFPNMKKITKEQLSYLNLNEIKEMDVKLDRYITKNSYNYFRSKINIREYLLEIHPFDITPTDIGKYKRQLDEYTALSKKAYTIMENEKKRIYDKNVRGTKFDVKKESKSKIKTPTTPRPIKIDNLSSDEIYIIIDSKHYKLKVNIDNLSNYFQFFDDIDNLTLKTRDVFSTMESEKKARQLKRIRYVELFWKKHVENETFSMIDYKEYLPLYIYCIVKVNKIGFDSLLGVKIILEYDDINKQTIILYTSNGKKIIVKPAFKEGKFCKEMEIDTGKKKTLTLSRIVLK